jgi:mannose-1-phosphate guanylyltransferase
MQAILLVGGEGTRLRPLTASVPKPALTLVDRPFLAHMVEWLAGHGVGEVVLACGFQPDILREVLGDGLVSGVSVTYVAEPEPLGTAGGIRFAADQLGDRLEDRFLALNGDVLCDLDLSALVAAHEERAGSSATIAVHRVDDAAAFGLVRSDAGGVVESFLEKTGEHEPGDVNAGIYVLERSVLDRVEPGARVSIEREVFPRLVGRGLRSLSLNGYWKDLGTPDRYLEASWDILEGRVKTLVEPTAPGVFVDAAAEVAAGARIGPRAVVGPACRVGESAEVSETVLLEGSRLGAGAIARRSILAPHAAIGPGALAEGAVLGEAEVVAA